LDPRPRAQDRAVDQRAVRVAVLVLGCQLLACTARIEAAGRRVARPPRRSFALAAGRRASRWGSASRDQPRTRRLAYGPTRLHRAEAAETTSRLRTVTEKMTPGFVSPSVRSSRPMPKSRQLQARAARSPRAIVRRPRRLAGCRAGELRARAGAVRASCARRHASASGPR